MSESSPKSSIYKDRTSRLLEKVYQSASAMAEQNQGRNRGIAAGTAAAFISMGLDKLNGDAENPDYRYSDKEIDAIRELAGAAAEQQTQNSHFMDKFLERMLRHTMDIDSEEAEELEKRIHDNERKSKPPLSIRILASNFKRLSSKMTGFFALQYGVIHILTWKNPTKTLCYLFLYTCLCLWPHLVLAYPLLFLLFGVLIPGYIYRHPMASSQLIKTKKRGQSLWEFLTSSSDTSIVDDLLSDEFMQRMEDNNDVLRPVSSRSSESSTVYSSTASTALNVGDEDDEEAKEKKKRKKNVKSQMNLLMNMRDLQNLTTDLLKGMDEGQKFWFDTAGFKDEKLSTLVAYGVLVATGVITFLGQFIPWRLIFIQAGWVVVGIGHPGAKALLGTLSKQRRKQKASNKPKESAPKREGNIERADIIVDDPPEMRKVEVFELHVKYPGSDDWSFYCYSTSFFDLNDPLRVSGQRPVGVNNLSKVTPPRDWKFDMIYANKWKIDTKPQEFVQLRSVSQDLFVIRAKETEGWIYDDEWKVPEASMSFRRRRLWRESYRYGRQPRAPTT